MFDGLLWIALIGKDSLFWLIEKKNDKDGLAQFKKIYSYRDEKECQQAWEQTKDNRLKFLSQRTEKPGVLQVLTDRKYRDGTYLVCLAAIINQMSGINAMIIYSASIFSDVS